MDKIWSPSENALILALHAEGKSRRQIAKHFGVTRNAICGKLDRLLKRRQPSMTYKPVKISGLLQFRHVAGLLTYQPQPVVAPRRITFAQHIAAVDKKKPGWKIGQRMSVTDVEANIMGFAGPVKWSGEGVIDMIVHDYFRIVDAEHFAWVGAPIAPHVYPNTWDKARPIDVVHDEQTGSRSDG